MAVRALPRAKYSIADDFSSATIIQQLQITIYLKGPLPTIAVHTKQMIAPELNRNIYKFRLQCEKNIDMSSVTLTSRIIKALHSTGPC